MADVRGARGEEVPWAQVVIYQVDERVAPDGDPARNLTHLRASLGDAPAEVRAPVGARPGGGGRRVRRCCPTVRSHPPRARPRRAHGLARARRSRPRRHRPPRRGHRPLPGAPPHDPHLSGPRHADQLLWLVTGEDKRRPLAQVLAGDPSVPGGRVVAARRSFSATPRPAGTPDEPGRSPQARVRRRDGPPPDAVASGGSPGRTTTSS